MDSARILCKSAISRIISAASPSERSAALSRDPRPSIWRTMPCSASLPRVSVAAAVGSSGVGKAKLAKYLERKLFELNYQSYLLDGRNVALGVSADIGSKQKKQEGEVLRRFGEVAKLFLDAGHVVISTSNVFNQEDHSDLRLLVEPCQVVEIFVTDETKQSENCDIKLSIIEAEKENEAANTSYNYFKDNKILTGHNYSI